MIGDVEGIEAQSNMMPLAMLRAYERNREFPKELHVKREEGRKALAVWCAHIVLQNIDARIRIAAVHVCNRAEFEASGERKYPPSDDAARNVVRQNPVHIGTDYRLLKRNHHAGEIVQVTARLAPDVGSTYLIASPNSEMRGSLRFTIVCRTGIGESQKRWRRQGSCEWVNDKQVCGMAVDIADAQKHISAQFVVGLRVPRQIAR